MASASRETTQKGSYQNIRYKKIRKARVYQYNTPPNTKCQQRHETFDIYVQVLLMIMSEEYRIMILKML